MRTLTLKINSELAGRSVKNLLKSELGLSESLIRRIKFTGGIMLDGRSVRVNSIVGEGGVLTAVIGEDCDRKGVFPYQILYEDEDLLIFNKPASVAAHSSSYEPDAPSVERACMEYFGSKLMYHPVSRLDKGTTGIMTVAKNGYMHERMRRQIGTNDFRKTYIGIAVGEVEPHDGMIDLAISRDETSAIKRKIDPKGSPSLSEYHVLSVKNGYTLLRLIPHTGRTHQLRLHMAAIGFPLAGDWLYGTEDARLISRPALHSQRLGFIHPLSLEWIDISAPMPEDMKKLLE